MKKTVIDAYSMLKTIRETHPIVHHLTNWVTIYDCANIVKVFGGSPIMAHDPDEVQQMTGIANALVLNIGTLTTDLVAAMEIAALRANKKGIPIVLDVCGAGASKLRDDSCFSLLNKAHIDIIKGNASEVARIAGHSVVTKGVDSTEVEADLISVASTLASKRKCTVVITGKEDFISNGRDNYIVKNGHELMSHVVGTGCMAASVIGTFAAVEKDHAAAAAGALVSFEISAELAAKKAKGPGTFKEKLYDYAFTLDQKTIAGMQKVFIV